ncbi:lipoyl/octanoyl transferase [Yamadazyma tenuis]|uniref:Octanoyltransferase n=1 Tax=Candida tenuis (strain ATCC 10573 / BCRC 21748 / CBS 615 / JCM 9827 / NBRC 10315 / NRRL Y-1498 / VKM Y-70) TaxID=590646 RepID=G3AX67_CANTC|nr:lipoyltransferase [Yamadazyma tenuis ATCC 10573]EGV66699.1 lipoyltransferase [Yamadazyma tenuis ATCC 10573]WEJ95166.1 lipoyl/octanoyl transferase [Yamadazyma tenuis]
MFRRFNSTCSKFVPLIENYKTLRHVHFDGLTPFIEGQALQQSMVDANLSFKEIEAKIKRNKLELSQQGLEINDYEKGLIDKILEMKPHPTLLTFQFNNVYTGGKKIKRDPTIHQQIKAFEELGCEFHQLERGGDVTWHGEGHLVAYLILDLKKFKDLTVRCFVDSVLLKSLQDVLNKNYDLDSYLNKNPGVWMEPDNLKIASVGTNIQRGITSYGIGLNVKPDLKYLNTFTMCGLPGTSATSIQQMKPGADLDLKAVAYMYSKEIANNLNITTVEHMNGEEIRHQSIERNEI